MQLRASVVTVAVAALLVPLVPGAASTAVAAPVAAGASDRVSEGMATTSAGDVVTGPLVSPGPSPASAAAAVDYWTDERIAAAEPLPVPSVHTAPDGARSGASASTTARRSRGKVWSGGGRVVATTGRLFFTVRGQASVCTASVVAGARRDLLVTAGHCLRSPGRWHKNVLFMPGYDRGAEPYGRWAAKNIWVTRQWYKRKRSPNNARGFRYDVGFVALEGNGEGRQIASVVGAQNIAFGTKGTPKVHAFGYPAEHQFNGERLRFCNGGTDNDRFGRFNRRIRCSMNGGASGGPWLTRFDRSSGIGTQISVNSYTYGDRSNLKHMQGPRFGTAVRRGYLKLQPRAADGRFLRDLSDGRVYRVAGGAPIWVTTWDAFGGPQPTTDVSHVYLTRKLRKVPRNSFIRGTSTGKVYRVHRGHAYHVTSWDPWGGPQPYVDVDQVAINRCDHLRCGPFGTVRVKQKGKRVTVSGWAMDPDRAAPITVQVRVDGKLRKTVRANHRRRDVAKLLHRGQRYGYGVRVRVGTGRSKVCVVGVDVGTGTNSRLGCRKVRRRR